MIKLPVLILAGGLGTRLSELTETIPKPMVEVGNKPILWHIMKYYAHFGHNEFYVALGYKGHLIKSFFANYHHQNSSMTINLATGEIKINNEHSEDWIVHLIDTGPDTMTGGRVLQIKPLLKSDTFMLTYGDGLSNIDINSLLEFHCNHGKVATITAVRPPARFGGLLFEGNRVNQFTEKPQIGEGWINGGFMVLETAIFDYLKASTDSLELNALEQLAQDGQLMAYRHDKFWQCMDTLRDLRLLQSLWDNNSAPWKVWSE